MSNKIFISCLAHILEIVKLWYNIECKIHSNFIKGGNIIEGYF